MENRSISPSFSLLNMLKTWSCSVWFRKRLSRCNIQTAAHLRPARLWKSGRRCCCMKGLAVCHPKQQKRSHEKSIPETWQFVLGNDRSSPCWWSGRVNGLVRADSNIREHPSNNPQVKNWKLGRAFTKESAEWVGYNGRDWCWGKVFDTWNFFNA